MRLAELTPLKLLLLPGVTATALAIAGIASSLSSAPPPRDSFADRLQQPPAPAPDRGPETAKPC